jgi:hypothetical protein
LDESRDRASGGAGLGLPIVREVVIGHQGAVAIDESPEGGCRVIVQLPIAPIDEPLPKPIRLPGEWSHSALVTSPEHALEDSAEADQPPVVESR